jgi:hypothetical protein
MWDDDKVVRNAAPIPPYPSQSHLHRTMRDLATQHSARQHNSSLHSILSDVERRNEACCFAGTSCGLAPSPSPAIKWTPRRNVILLSDTSTSPFPSLSCTKNEDLQLGKSREADCLLTLCTESMVSVDSCATARVRGATLGVPWDHKLRSAGFDMTTCLPFMHNRIKPLRMPSWPLLISSAAAMVNGNL